MNYFAPRTCTEIPGTEIIEDKFFSRPLEKFRECDCYVLLGPPGSGKTEAFKKEAIEQNGHYVTAHNFITSENLDEWRDRIIFIDGLDETRADESDKSTPLDKVRKTLQKLGCPRFRLSCREADWFEAGDRNHLKDVSPGREVKVLCLDPLCDKSIVRILRSNYDITSPEQLIDSARDKGICYLLRAPWTLEMIAAADADGKCPETLTEALDLSCRKLVREHRQGHEPARSNIKDIDELLLLAGKLCAIHLLTASKGYVLTDDKENCGYISPKQLQGEKQEFLRGVLSSRLFESENGIHITPAHRQISEFLGGKYVAELVEKGLPVMRVLALMTGYDGGFASHLRGFSAWIAAQVPQGRTEIVERDPIGVILYGDIRRFSVDEKCQILDRVAAETRKNQWYTRTIGDSPLLACLATRDMWKYFRDALNNTARHSSHQSFIGFLLKALKQGPGIPRLGDALLLGLARDGTWRLHVRDDALAAFVQQQRSDDLAADAMTELLDDVYAGWISDPYDELKGILLKKLYPDFLSPSDIWEYFRTPEVPSFYGGYAAFWLTDIVAQSEPDQLAELIEEFYVHMDNLTDEYVPGEKHFCFFSMVFLSWLARFLHMTGDRLPLDCLCRWLWVAADPKTPDYRTKKGISTWLDKNPETKKSVLKKWMECNNANPYETERMLFGKPGLGCVYPADFGLWCLYQSIKADNEQLEKFFLDKTADAMENSVFDKGLSEKAAENALRNNQDVGQKLLALRSGYREISERRESFTEKQRAGENQELRELTNYVELHKKALDENRCPPHLLHYLARVYFGEDEDFPGRSPEERLRKFSDNNELLVNAVLKAFRDSVSRSDVPDEASIMQMRKNSETPYLALPFLAGLEELFHNDSVSEKAITEKQKKQSLAFYYNTSLPETLSASQPLWYQKLLKTNTDMVLDVLISSARLKMHKSKEDICSLYKLAFRHNQTEAAILMTAPLLEIFPVRCTGKQLHGLNYLLISALVHCDKEFLPDMVSRKLSCSGMNIAQRICWLATGAVISSPGPGKLEEYVAGNQHRISKLVEFIKEFPDELIRRIDVSASEILIRLAASSSHFAWLPFKPLPGFPAEYALDEAHNRPEPSDSEKTAWEILLTKEGNPVYRFIQQLASIQSPGATDVLERLLRHDWMKAWKQHLTEALSRQRLIRRETCFNPCNINQVLETLSNKEPANAADLSALATDVLTDLAREIRDGNISNWCQYWNMDEYNKPVEPLCEYLCRDRLLSYLRMKLNPGVDVQPENHHGNNDNISDIRISYNTVCSVPIEIKRSSHKYLWNPTKNQIIVKHPGGLKTGGYGIYLVLWFGKKWCMSPGKRRRPKDATELRKRLREMLTDNERRKTSICVIDVVKP